MNDIAEKKSDDDLFCVSGAFGGGEDCEKAILPLDRLLEKVLREMKATDYLDGLSCMEIWLRIGGELIDWEGESGPKRLASGRNPPRMIIDLMIPRSDWEGKSQEEVREIFAKGVEQCVDLMLARAVKRKAVKDETRLRRDFAAAMQRFRTEPIPPYVPLGTPQYL